MNLLDEHYAFRASLVDALRADLIGPAEGAEETFEERPIDRYVIGVLWPRDDEGEVDVPDDPDDATAADDSNSDDPPVAQSRVRYPSSMGMTFTVDVARITTVELAVRATHYLPVQGDGARRTERTRVRRQEVPAAWRRTEPVIEPVQQQIVKSGVFTYRLEDGLELYVLVRERKACNVTVTAVVRNTHPDEAGARDRLAWFQVGLVARTEVPAIVDRTRVVQTGDDEDLRTSALLYRDVRSFAAGHGCAAVWRPTAEPRVSEVRTEFLPESELLRARPGAAGRSDLRMAFLAEGSTEMVVASLRGLVSAYREWITDQRARLAELDGLLRETGEGHLDTAERIADRIDAGVDHLQLDDTSMQAFRLANRAMHLQRNRQDWVRGGANGPASENDQVWRPFQIAFILLNLPGIADRDSDDRRVADLLWFPTGGGKTEAYLALIAFTILRRRLVDSDSQGVAVIMRYTLRLLTIQQFERATMLICSLETLRSAAPDLGQIPFTIGLWVGKKATPNTLEDARKALRKLGRGETLDEENPVQLTTCPWCNAPLRANTNYSVVSHPHEHLVIACGNAPCAFSTGLPVHVVDEDIYRARPELLIGTVDKFARMPWKAEVVRLFGQGTDHRPELIIQDELHLISGPLGSIVGLYEAAIDAACSRPETNGRSSVPKVIASTATIRRARQQVRAIFDRDVAQFPPPGLDPDESFFATRSDRSELGSRLYIGAMAPGTSHATLLIRVYAALLQAAEGLDAGDDVRDPYWTLIGYFNSLRVLGGAYLQVNDDVRARLAVIAGRSGGSPRKINEPSELTSRVPSSEIPERLKNLEHSLPSVEGRSIDDVVLATNMISVGLDVDRLGLMAVMGQPQSSSEYIQATSRVGRKHPGLVITLYNSARSRDRSHYEGFMPFHQALYRAVEASSVTPWAARARDRGLHAVLASIARLTVPSMNGDHGAELVGNHLDALRAAANDVVERVARCDADSADATEEHIGQLIKAWWMAADARPGLKYWIKDNPDASLLLDASEALDIGRDTFGGTEVPWPTLTSMRDVDVESGLFQIPPGRQP